MAVADPLSDGPPHATPASSSSSSGKVACKQVSVQSSANSEAVASDPDEELEMLHRCGLKISRLSLSGSTAPRSDLQSAKASSILPGSKGRIPGGTVLASAARCAPPAADASFEAALKDLQWLHEDGVPVRWPCQ